MYVWGGEVSKSFSEVVVNQQIGRKQFLKLFTHISQTLLNKLYKFPI